MSIPRRRHSPAVYRRRRRALLILLLMVALLVWVLIAQPWAGSPKDAPRASSSAASQPVPQTTTTLPGGDATSAAGTPAPSDTLGACTADDLSVEPITDKNAYGQGQNPQFSISLTNTSTHDCTLDVGSAAQVFTVMSGSDVWWRSTDCQKDGTHQIVTITAGQTARSASPVTWDRTRSSSSSCGASSRPAAPGGGATYRLSVSIGGIASTKQASFLLY